MSMWLALLAGPPLVSAQTPTPLTIGVEVDGSVAQGQMTYYSFMATPEQLELTLTVTPTHGNPDLYINTGATLDATQLPDRATAESSHTDPGDDALAITLVPPTAGSPGRLALQIGVWGESASDYKLVLSAADTTVTLTAGESKRFASPLGQYRYFVANVPRGHGIDVSVTPLTGDPDLFVAASVEHPDSTAAECTATGAGHVSWCSAVEGSRYEHVEIPSTDPNLCTVSPTCLIYISVHARTATTYTVVATWGDAAIRLIDGLPQAAQIAAPGLSRSYKTRVAGTHADLSISLTPQYGNSHLYVQTGHAATAMDFKWTSDTRHTTDDRLLISHDSQYFCADCDYFITVISDAATSYTISATSSSGIKVLESGAPCSELVNEGRYEYFKLFVTVPKVEVQVIMTAFSGNPDMYLSLSTPYPNATNHHKSSNDAEGDLITLSTIDFGPSASGDSFLRPKDEELYACLNPPVLLGTPHVEATCVLYISVYGASGASSFSLTAGVEELAAGFSIDAPLSIAADYEFTTATFGPPLGNPPISACVVYASPGYGCPPAGAPDDWQLANADEVANCIALVDRGPHGATLDPTDGQMKTPDELCPFPGRYFANKVMQAQKAHAVAVIVANDPDSRPGLAYMGAVSGDHAAGVTIPSIFVTQETGDLIKQQLTSGVRATLTRPIGRLPMLVPGIPQVGATDGDQMRFYELWTGPGHDTITITVAPRFGNPDIYVTSTYDRYLPSKNFHRWTSVTEGSESLTIDSRTDPNACSSCIYYVGVLGGTDSTGGAASTSYTIMATLQESMVTVQSNVPIVSQEVQVEEYRYYRFFVDRPGQGLTVSLTLDAGDADLFVSFEQERPNVTNAQFSATGQVGCQTVDCGNSILHGDAVHINAAAAQQFCDPMPCLAYVGVYGAMESVFNLLITVSDNLQETPVQLLDGVEQTIELANAGDFGYFYFHVSDDVKSFDVNVVPTSGDPDLYISHNQSEVYPDRKNFVWRSADARGESVHISTDDPRACINCNFRLSVYAWTPLVSFSIVVTTEQGTRALRDGAPASVRVDVGAVKYFRYRLLTASKLDVVVTPYSGNPSLFVQFGYKPFNPDNRTEPGALVEPFSSTQASGLEVVTLDPTDPSFCEVPCTIFVAITNEGGTNASCSVLVQQRASGPATLIDGQPQAGIVSAGAMRYYILSINDMTRGLTVTLVPRMGQPKLYLSADASLPTASSYLLAADATSPVLRIPSKPTGGGVYYLGVDGQGRPANYTLVARSGRAIETLQDRQQTSATIEAGDTYFFAADVPAGSSAATLLVSPLQGAVSVAVSPTVVRVDEWYQPEVQALIKQRVSVSKDHPVALALTAGARNMIAVTNQMMGPSAAPYEVGLTLSLAPGQELMLPDGKPQFYVARKDEPVHFVYTPPGSIFSLSAVELDEPPDAALAMYVGKMRFPEAQPAASTEVRVERAEVGQLVEAAFRGEVEYACEPNPCTLYVTVVPSQDANLTVTASAAGRTTQLPIGRTRTVSDVVTVDEYKDFVLKLEPADDKDDNLRVDLQLCSGSAHLYVGSEPSPRQGSHRYAMEEEPPTPLWLTSPDLAGRSAYYVSVHGSGPAKFQLQTTYQGRPPHTTSLLGDAGALGLDVGGRLTLSFTQLSVPCPLGASLGTPGAGGQSCAPDAPPVRADAARVTYAVYVAMQKPATVLSTACGIKEAGAWQLYNSTMATDESLAYPGATGEVSLDEGGGGRLSVELPDAMFDCAACEHTLVPGDPYLVTLVAQMPLGYAMLGGQVAQYRAVYAAQPWVPQRGGGGGSMSGGGIFLLLLCIALALVGAAYAYLVKTGRRSWRDDREKASIAAATAADKVRGLDLPGAVKRFAARAAPVSSARRARVDGMTAPLTSAGAYVPPSQTTDGQLPPLLEQSPEALGAQTRFPLATVPDAIEPLQLSVQVDPAAAAARSSSPPKPTPAAAAAASNGEQEERL